MNVATVLAEVIGAAFILVGLTTLNKKYITAVLSDLEKSKGLTWLTGVVTFLLGAITLGLYNTWSSDWQVVITIIGWLMVLKGAFITLLPNTSMKFYRKVGSNAVVVVAGVVAIVIGLVLFSIGFTA
jgi:hypothetical protein